MARSRRSATGRVPDILAAVDLGSNSFHLVVARYTHGQLVIIDRLREMVRLGSGLEKSGRIDPDAAARALACLSRFGQRLRDMRAGSVRVVGTNALRVARKKKSFLDRARHALGFPIEIISGVEEARLIYAGVANTSPGDRGRRLVVDIGGGSTELIVGEGAMPLELQSLWMGCVSFSERFFPDGRLSPKRLHRARVAARQQLEPVASGLKALGWQSAAGSAGTARAIGEAIREIDHSATFITPLGVERLLALTARVKHIRDLKLHSITEERRPIFAGGLCIMAGVLDMLEIRAMRIAEGAMREGLLYDLIGRLEDEDARDRSVRAMQQRYHVDTAQAARVERTVLDLLAQVCEVWKLNDRLAEQALSWASRLHEIGLDVSHSSYHRHGAYLLEHADMFGFPREEQRLLARLVGSHRRKLALDTLSELIPPWDELAFRLIVLLRLAVLLHRGRSGAPLPKIRLTATARMLRLQLPARWMREHALTRADLEQEVAYLKAHGLRLQVSGGA